MLVFKVSWIPWLLLIGAFGLIFSDNANDVGWGIIIMIVSIIWLIARYSKKNSYSSKSTASSSRAAVQPEHVETPRVSTPPVSTTPVSAPKSANGSLQCPNCKNVEGEGNYFCSKCGTKIR